MRREKSAARASAPVFIALALSLSACGQNYRPANTQQVTRPGDPLSSAQDAPPPGEFTIRNVTFIEEPSDGPWDTRTSGCTQSNSVLQLSPDNRAMSVIFEDFMVDAPAGSGVVSRQKYCNMNIEFNVPAGWSYAVKRVDWRGAAILDPHNFSWVSSGYFFGRERGYFDEHIYGPFPTEDIMATAYLGGAYLRGLPGNPVNGPFQVGQELSDESLVWSPCEASDADKTLKLRSNVYVANQAGGSATVFMDSLDADFNQNFGIVWRQCEPGVTENMQLDAADAILTNDRGNDLLYASEALASQGYVNTVQNITLSQNGPWEPLRIGETYQGPTVWDEAIEMRPPTAWANGYTQAQFTPMLLTSRMESFFMARLALAGNPECGDGVEVEALVKNYLTGAVTSIGTRTVNRFGTNGFVMPLNLRGTPISMILRVRPRANSSCDRLMVHDARVVSTAGF